jgi:hypothetical protein
VRHVLRGSLPNGDVQTSCDFNHSNGFYLFAYHSILSGVVSREFDLLSCSLLEAILVQIYRAVNEIHFAGNLSVFWKQITCN